MVFSHALKILFSIEETQLILSQICPAHYNSSEISACSGGILLEMWVNKVSVGVHLLIRMWSHHHSINSLIICGKETSVIDSRRKSTICLIIGSWHQLSTKEKNTNGINHCRHRRYVEPRDYCNKVPDSSAESRTPNPGHHAQSIQYTASLNPRLCWAH